MYANNTTQGELASFVAGWQVDGLGTKSAFTALQSLLEEHEGAVISFHARPGITCSLRGHIGQESGEGGLLYAMVDIIDDDPKQRWLSVCFYGERITDPEERGDFVPGGLLGQDAVCFYYDSNDPELLAYIRARIDESYKSSLPATS